MRTLGLILLTLLSLPLRGEVVADLYSATVPVSSQSSAALASASRDALAEIFVKVSGSSEVLSNPAIDSALKEARSRVQQYAYVRDEQGEGGLSARFEFESDFVTRTVTDAGAPLWTANRPRVLVWMVLEQNGERYFVNSETQPELAEELLAAFSSRGVPAQLPLFDLTDSTTISTEEVWRLYAPALEQASSRYQVEDILVGRAVMLSTGSWTGDWSYLRGINRIDRSITAPQSYGFLQSGAGMVAEDMAGRYAVVASGNGQQGVRMAVTGVHHYADYAGIVSWLESLELIEHANVELISGDRIELRLHAHGDAQQLASVIGLEPRLLPLPATAAGSGLDYQWTN